MERTIHFTLVDQVSTLNRITSAFVRLQCNIDELHVKHSDKEGISNMKLKVNIKDDDTFKIVLKKLSQQVNVLSCLLYTSPSPRDVEESRMPSSA